MHDKRNLSQRVGRLVKEVVRDYFSVECDRDPAIWVRDEKDGLYRVTIMGTNTEPRIEIQVQAYDPRNPDGN